MILIQQITNTSQFLLLLTKYINSDFDSFRKKDKDLERQGERERGVREGREGDTENHYSNDFSTTNNLQYLINSFHLLLAKYINSVFDSFRKKIERYRETGREREKEKKREIYRKSLFK